MPSRWVGSSGAREEIGGQHRRHEAGGHQREEHRDGDGQAELLEILAGDAAHEADRREDRHDRGGDRDDGEADFVGGFERGAIGGLAHAHVPHDVLDLDDGVVHQNAGDDGDREQADEVQRKADRLHDEKRRDDRQRQGARGDERRAPIAQEEENDDHGQRRALDQRLHRRGIIADDVGDLRVDVGERHLRMLGVDLFELFGDEVVDRDVAVALGAHDAEGDDRLVVEAREGALLGGGVRHRAEFIEPHLAPARQRDRQRGEVRDLMRPRERADRLLLARHLPAAAAKIDVVGLHLRVHRRRRHAEGKQLLRIQSDPDFAVDAAGARHRADAFDRLQFARHRVVDEPRQLLRRQAGRRGGVGDERQAFDVDAVDQRFVDRARQVAANAGHLVLHVVERAVDVDRTDIELDDRGGDAVGDGRDDVPNAVEAGDRVLHLLGDLSLKLRRRRARLGDRDRDNRNVDVGKALDRKILEGGDAEQRQHRKEHDRGDRAADRPGGNVKAHSGPLRL